MPQFRYTARTATGEELTGELTAGDETWARHSLSSAGLEIVALESTEAPPADRASPTSTQPIHTASASGPRLSTSQSAQLVGHVTTATSSGLPLEDTLDALADGADDHRLAVAARQLAARLRAGVPLEQATVMLDKQLPVRVRALLEAGVRCGNPGAVFESYARQEMAARATSQKIASAMAFPLVILLIVTPILLFFALYLIPMYEELIGDFALTLPMLTLVTIRLAHVLPLVIVGFSVVMVVIWLVVHLGAVSRLVCQLRGAVPFFGRLWTFAGHQELAATLGTLARLRIPLPESMAHTANLLADRNLARACRKASARAAAGAQLSDCMNRSIHFDRMLTALVRWGEDHDLVPDALQHASDYYAERIEQQAGLVRRILPPLLLVTVVMIALIVFVSLFLPLVNLIQNLA